MKKLISKKIQGAEKIRKVESGNTKQCFIGLNQPKKPGCIDKK